MIRFGTGRVCATLATVGVVLADLPATAAQAAPAPLSFEATTVPFNGSYPPVSGGLGVDRFVGGTGKDQATDFTLGDGDTQGGTVRRPLAGASSAGGVPGRVPEGVVATTGLVT